MPDPATLDTGHWRTPRAEHICSTYANTTSSPHIHTHLLLQPRKVPASSSRLSLFQPQRVLPRRPDPSPAQAPSREADFSPLGAAARSTLPPGTTALRSAIPRHSQNTLCRTPLPCDHMAATATLGSPPWDLHPGIASALLLDPLPTPWNRDPKIDWIGRRGRSVVPSASAWNL